MDEKMRIRCVDAIWANAKEMAWRDLGEFDLPMRFSDVFQLFRGSWCLFRISRFGLMSLVTSFVTKACKITL